MHSMSTTDLATSTTGLPVGTWQLDPTHSSASFAVKHMIVATFRGRFENFDATLTVDESSATLVGTVQAGSIVVKDENLQGHLGSPDFFDIERYPEISFTSTDIRRDGDKIVIDGDLTIKDHTHRVEARGSVTGPAVTLGDVTKLGLTLETVIDRTEFGLNWNAPLPKGGFAVSNEVTLTVELELALSES
jgi:polyisoprenoid-binding protein YceI